MIYFGIRRAYNDANRHEDGTEKAPAEREVLELKSRSEIGFPDDMGFAERLDAAQLAWRGQSPDAAPVWVSGDDAGLVSALGSIYGCEVRPVLHEGEERLDANGWDDQ